MTEKFLPGVLLSPSINAVNLIKEFESCRLVGYLPTKDDVPTIGWGATGRGIHVGDRWTQMMADARLVSDVHAFAAAVRRLLGTALTTQSQFDALVSFAYNVGIAALAGSTLLRKHKAGDYAGAAAEFPKWDHQNHKEIPGLLRRREAEAALYKRSLA